MELEQQLEAVLFWKGEAVTIKWLVKALETDEAAILHALGTLENTLAERGVRIIRFEDEVTLTTAPKASETIERLTKEELVRDLGKAGLETLSIILYRGPVARREIDYIRGVNSQFILRNLLIRGLIERVPNPSDERSFLYKTTLELLAHLGLEKPEALPEYAEVRAEIEAWKNAKTTDEEKESIHPTELPTQNDHGTDTPTA